MPAEEERGKAGGGEKQGAGFRAGVGTQGVARKMSLVANVSNLPKRSWAVGMGAKLEMTTFRITA